jgi:hypothetical protein
MVITFPMIDLLRGTPARQHRTGGVHIVDQLPGRPGRQDVPLRGVAPLMQPVEAVAAGVVRLVVRTRDVPVDM